MKTSRPIVLKRAILSYSSKVNLALYSRIKRPCWTFYNIKDQTQWPSRVYVFSGLMLVKVIFPRRPKSAVDYDPRFLKCPSCNEIEVIFLCHCLYYWFTLKKKKVTSRISGSFIFTSSCMKFSWGTVKSLDFLSVNLKNKII